MPQSRQRRRASSSLNDVPQPKDDSGDAVSRSDAVSLNSVAPSGRPIRRRTRQVTNPGEHKPAAGGRRGRRRGTGASIKVIKWRDIPAQVNGMAGDEKVQIELPHRFQAAIDRAAMLADKKDANSYVAEMGQSVHPTPGDDLQQEAEQLVAQIEAEFTMDRLNTFVRNGGFEETP